MISKVNMELSQVYYGIYHPNVPVYFEDIYCTKTCNTKLRRFYLCLPTPVFLHIRDSEQVLQRGDMGLQMRFPKVTSKVL
jgi:hypothetical protein